MEKPIRYYIRKWINDNTDSIEIAACTTVGFLIPSWGVLGVFWEFSLLSMLTVICLLAACWCSVWFVLDHHSNIFERNANHINIFNFWWYPFRSSINMSEYNLISYNLEEWCMEHCCGPFEHDNDETWYFLCKSDIVAFKLTWAK